MRKKLHTIRTLFRKGRRDRGGFTLVELIVVLVLIGVIAAVSAGGMIGYTSYASYKRNNDNAKTLFAAAQSAITYYKASGKLDQFRQDVEALGHEPAYVPVNAFEAENEMLADAGEASGRRNETISYLMIKKSDYEAIENAVKAGETEDGITDPETKLLFQFLRDYVTDLGIWNASICVEFDAADGVVSGVLYSDRADSFTYEDVEEALDIKDRGESRRRRVSLGYYSTVLSERAPASVENLKIKQAQLINGETLDVQWFLEKKYQYLKGEQTYVIDLYEEDGSAEGADKVKRASIVLDKEEARAISGEDGPRPYVRAESVTLYSGDSDTEGKKLELSEAHTDDGTKRPEFHAFLVEDEKYGSGLALSLDALDAGLSEISISDSDAQQRLLGTYSVRRLALDEGGKHYGLTLDGRKEISAEVSIDGQADSGKTTDAQNPLFAAYGAPEGETGDAYEIANARHLYNVDYQEQYRDPAEESTAVYKIVQNFAWGGTDGLLSRGRDSMRNTKFFRWQTADQYDEGDETTRTRYPAFPGIAELKKGAVLTSGESLAPSKKEGEEDNEMPDGGWTIDCLALEAPLVEQAGGSYAAAEGVGLVRSNGGTIQNLKLGNVDVRGIVVGQTEETVFEAYAAKNAGAFCGVNNGTLQNLEVLSGYVTGGENVGGVLGSFGAFDKITECTGLTNGAEVTGLKNVGGIVGLLDGTGAGTEAGAVALSGAANTGLVYGWNNEQNVNFVDAESVEGLSLENFGGIAGCVKNAVIRSCTSSQAPQKGTDGTAAALTAEQIQERLNGNFVGGIVGYLDENASVEECAGGASGSYVLGRNFVGGVVGVNASGKGLAAAADKNSNAASVIGRRFVGGIVGVNGKLPKADGGAAVPEIDELSHGDIEADAAAQISGWNNSGAVIAAAVPRDESEALLDSIRPAYVGGIAGMNAGTIINCAVSLNEEAAELTGQLGGDAADFVGGVAGCSGGSISAAGQTVSGQVKGGNFVGGLVGYNDGTKNGGSITGYSTAGFTVEGKNFVGGAVGLNTSAALLNAEGGTLACDAKSVKGGSYVGGYAGANIVALAADTTITQSGSAGNVTADGGFAGGLFGYNRVVTPDVLNGLFYESVDDSADGDVISMLTAADGAEELVLATNIFAIDEKDTSSGSASLQILKAAGGAAGGTAAAQPEAGSAEPGPMVSGKIFVGGVLGYNASHTVLTVQDYESDVSVQARSATDSVLGLFAKYGEEKAYSFSGGILGYVTENTTLQNCSISQTATVQADGATYLGGLAEINEGKIISCRAATVGGENRNYVGGIVGVNGYVESTDTDDTVERKAGELTDCVLFENYVVTGSSTVGGLAAENYGRISGQFGTGAGGTVTAGGTDIGGLAGVNYGEITDVSNIWLSSLDASASRDGSVGGVAGVNRGNIIHVNVSPYMRVQGGTKTGGIAGTNDGTISGNELGSTTCMGTAIANEGMAGAIAGENLGLIEHSTFSKPHIMMGPNVSANGPASLGGIAGVNRGTIYLSKGDLDYAQGKYPRQLSSENAVYVGGVAGENYGMIDGAQSDEYAQVCIEGLADTVDNPTTIGGVAGRNEGTIHNILFNGTIDGYGNTAEGSMQEPYSYGGIAGVNAGEGLIEDCGVGVCGNGSGAVADTKLTSDGQNYLGGVAGRNTGNAEIRDIDPVFGNSYDIKNVEITSTGALATGGIVGVNEENATIHDAVNGDVWIIQAKNGFGSATAGPTGGVVGLHTSAAGLYGLVSQAGTKLEAGTVGVLSENEAVGGIVGQVAADAVSGGRVVMQDCRNLGSVSGKARVGGILGEWASPAGGSISGCVNGKDQAEGTDLGDQAATVTASTPASAAGIVGGFSQMSQSVELLSCKNFGVVNNQLGAGVAAVGGDPKPQLPEGEEQTITGAAKIILTDCVNAGRITNDSSAGAGIAIYHSGHKGSISLELNRCRNYGRPSDGRDDQFAGLAAAVYEEGGSLHFDDTGEKLSALQVTIKNSIGVANVKYPTVPMKDGTEETFDALKNTYSSVNNYYYSAQEPDSSGSDPQPNPIETAGVGSAVSYATGAYLDAYEGEDPHVDKDYLKAVGQNGTAFDPNDGANIQNCRANYRTLDTTLAGACLSLEWNQVVDVQTAPKPLELQALNNGGLLEIVWRNQTQEEQDPDAESRLGAVYSSLVEIRLFDTQADAKNYDESSASGEEQAPLVYSATLYGGVMEHTLRASQSWMNKWVRVTVTNYAYSGAKTESDSAVTQILPSLKKPELEVRLTDVPTGQFPTYRLLTTNADDYTDCTLSFDVRSEVTDQDGETVKSKTYSASIDLDSEEASSFELSSQNVKLVAQEGNGDALFTTHKSEDVRLVFTNVQVSPKTEENDAAKAYFSDEAAVVAETADTEESKDMRSPSAKTSFTVICPSTTKLQDGYAVSMTTTSGENSGKMQIVLGGDQAEPSEAVYRAEVLQDVPMGDDAVLKNVAVAWTEQVVMSRQNNMLLSLPADYDPNTSDTSVRAYPLSPKNGQAKLVFQVEERMSGQDLLDSDYVNDPNRKPDQPQTQESEQTGDGQDGQTDGGQTGGEQTGDGQTDGGQDGGQTDEQNGQTGSEQTSDGQGSEQTGGQTSQADGGQSDGAQTAQMEPDEPSGQAESGAASLQADQETAKPVQIGIGEVESEEGQTAREITVADGYNVALRADGTFDVYYSVFLKQGSAYAKNVLTPQRASANEAEAASAEGQGSTGGSSIGASHGGASGGSSGGSTQTEPETEPQSEETTESETQSETESESASETESETVTEENTDYMLVPPAGAQLIPDWDQTTGVDENGEEREAASEEVFRNGLTLVADPVPNVSGYLMRASFHTAMPEEGGSMAPPYETMLTDMPEFDSMLILDMVDNTFTFQNIPSTYAGMYLCAQVASISMDGMWMSEWSDYIWVRLPSVCMDAREAVRGSIEQNYAVTVTDADGVMTDVSEATLLHPVLQWSIAKDQPGWEDSGYRMSIYGLQEPDIKPDSDQYKTPTVTVDLMRSANNLGYQIERSLTDEEQDEWHELHPNEEMPEYLHVIVPVEENEELFQQEHEINQTLQRLYEIVLDENALGENAYTYRYEQTAAGLGSQAIEDVCAKIQIREYSDNELLTEVTMIEFCLILPDAEEDGDATFLYDYRSVLGTHSVLLQPLAQSAFEEQREGITANRMQYTYLLNSQTRQEGSEELLDYQRVLKPNDAFDIPFDPEKEGLDVEAFKNYELLPRNYRPLLIWRAGTDEQLEQMASEAQAAAAASEAAQNSDAGLYYEGDGSVVFEQEDEQGGWEQNVGGTDAQTEPNTQGSTEVWIEVGVDPALTERQTERLTEQLTERQTEHQTEAVTDPGLSYPVQSETAMEPQTQAAAAQQAQTPETWTETAMDASGQPAAASERAVVGLGVFDEGSVL